MLETTLAKGAITAEDRSFTELWENITAPQYSILRFDIRGDLQHEMISGRRKFQVTTAERKITQDKILSEENDPFLNGAFRPIVVPDSVSIQTNPNALGDDEIRSILVSSDVAWEEWMKVITSPDTIARMMEISEGIEGMTLKRYKELAGRLSDTRPKTQIKDKDRDKFEQIRS